MKRFPALRAFGASLCLALGLVSTPSHAVDGFMVSGGCCADDANLVRVGAFWDWESSWFNEGDWHLTGYWELSGGYWRGEDGPEKDVFEVGLTPVFRLEPKRDGAKPYLEGAIGFHLLSDYKINSKDMSTNFQFGDHIAAGYMFGERGEYDIQLRLQHLSNASIEKPNPGINFIILRFGYRY
ncbi:MAG: acyloxyacyl hydrolase [Gammaproteobacteria bacterium]